jgi:chorismate dehydratase
MTLVVGEIAYANVVPLFDAWRAASGVGPDGDPAGVRIVRGDPASLNAALRRGEIDAAPCSSIEYAQGAARYRLLPDLAIASDGAVESVLLFARGRLGALSAGRPPVVALSPASATSNALVRVLLAERGLRARFVDAAGPSLAAAPAEADAAVVIGDEALLAAAEDAAAGRAAGFPHVYDLGALWREATGLPFVFGLWIVRDAVAVRTPAEVGRLAAALASAKRAAVARLPGLAPREAARTGLPADRLLAYWRRLGYDLGPREQAGLTTFFRLAARHGLLGAAPALRFVRPLP